MAKRVGLVAGITIAGIAAGCGASQPADTIPTPDPMPTAGLAGQEVTVFPLTMILGEETLGWEEALAPRREALDLADSLIAATLTSRVPEVNWVLPPALRRAADRAPGMLPQPDQMGTSLLRGTRVRDIPDPLRSQLRTLTGVAGDRWAFVPASLFYYRDAEGGGRAELTVVLADVRLGRIQWRTVAVGTGADPWVALWEALATLSPGVP